MAFYFDDQRHLVCLPFSVPHLHAMAKELSIKRCWFHKGGGGRFPHYDIPKKDVARIAATRGVLRVDGRTILTIIRSGGATDEQIEQLRRDTP